MKAKEELSLRGIKYDWIDLDELGKTAAEVTGRKVNTVPQIYLHGQYVGGYDDLVAFFNNEGVSLTEGDECRACEG
jgi:glutaredoxin